MITLDRKMIDRWWSLVDEHEANAARMALQEVLDRFTVQRDPAAERHQCGYLDGQVDLLAEIRAMRDAHVERIAALRAVRDKLG